MIALSPGSAGTTAEDKMKRKVVLLGQMEEELDREMKGCGPSYTETVALWAPCREALFWVSSVVGMVDGIRNDSQFAICSPGSNSCLF